MIDGDDARPTAAAPDTTSPRPAGHQPDPQHPDLRGADQPSTDQPRADQPSADQLSADQPSAGQLSADQPSADQPRADTSADAAGGDPRTPAGPAVRRRRTGYVVLLLACAAFAWVFDQSTKLWVLGTMTEGQITPVLPPLLRWHFIRNSGAAFSFGEGYTWVFTLVMIAVALFVLLVLLRRVASWWWAIALGLLLGGTLGNLTDRLFRPPGFGVGHVVDFIALPNFAIFNIADSAIVGGVITLCVLTVVGIGISGQRETASRRAAADHEDADETATEQTATEQRADTGDGPGRLR